MKLVSVFIALSLIGSSATVAAWPRCPKKCPESILSGRLECRALQLTCEKEKADQPVPPAQPPSNPEVPPPPQSGKLSIQTGGSTNGGNYNHDDAVKLPSQATSVIKSGAVGFAAGAVVGTVSVVQQGSSVVPVSLNENRDAYVIQSVGTSKCLDIPSSSGANSVVVQQYACHGQNNQLWMLELREGSPERGSYLIKNISSGKCLDVTGYSTDNATKIQQYDCHGQNNQLWNISKSGSNYIIKGAGSGKALDIPWGDKKDGIQLQQYDFHGQSNQRWIFGVMTK